MSTFPLREHEFVRSQDPSYAREMIGRIFVPHRLDMVGSGTPLNARAHVRRLVDTSITFVTYGSEVRVDPGALETFFTVHIALSGSATLWHRSAQVEVGPTVACVISPTEPAVMRWGADCAQLICRIERTAFEAHLSGLLGDSLQEPLRFEPEMRLDRGSGGSVRTIVRAVVEDIDHGSPLVDHPMSAQMFEQSLMSSLLIAQRHNYSNALSTNPRPAGSRQVSNAVALVESHPEAHQTIEDVAGALNVSARSLQRAIQRDLDTCFMCLLRDARLRRVHDDLRRAGPGNETVNDVFARWGLPIQGSTFNAYRQRFGQPPAQTLRSPA